MHWATIHMPGAVLNPYHCTLARNHEVIVNMMGGAQVNARVFSVEYSMDYLADNRCWPIIGGLRYIRVSVPVARQYWWKYTSYHENYFYFFYVLVYYICRWRLNLHGGIDGYSRLIMYLHCSTDNRASTVLRLFTKAASEFGLPSRCRSDKGAENRLVALYMLSQLGTEEACSLEEVFTIKELRGIKLYWLLYLYWVI